MYVIDFVPWRCKYGKSSWTCESSWLFYVCIFKILCMCQDVHDVMNFAVFVVWTTKTEDFEREKCCTKWLFDHFYASWIMTKKAKLHFGFAIKALYFFLNVGLELNHSSQSLHALCSCWRGAPSAHICFLYTWSWLRWGAEPALITLESPPGRRRASRLTR